MTDPREPFYGDELDYREHLRTRVVSLTDEKLDSIHALFSVTNLANIPYEHWSLAPRVRVLCKKEKARRAIRHANKTALVGEHKEDE